MKKASPGGRGSRNRHGADKEGLQGAERSRVVFSKDAYASASREAAARGNQAAAYIYSFSFGRSSKGASP